MKPIYLVFDTGCTVSFETTTDKAVAQSFFNEIMGDEKQARMIIDYVDERPEDITRDATETAAAAYLKDCSEFSDIPQWVYSTDAHDDWLRTNAWKRVEDRRERNHYAALRANL